MDIITDIVLEKERVMDLIKKYGYAAEHHYFCYVYMDEHNSDNVIFEFDNGCILAKKQKDEWYVVGRGILAVPEHRLNIFREFLSYIYSNGAKKLEVETEPEFRKLLLKELKEDYGIRPINCKLTWPVFDMKIWDEKMQGKDWKDMRYYWNKFFREHKVEFKGAHDFDETTLMHIYEDWKKQRTTGDRTYGQFYIRAIKNNFEGFDVTRIMVVDDKPVAITAGFKVPAINYYYSAVGIYTREFDRTGEIANMDDLINLKKIGIEIVDFGGGEDTLTAFKKKFHPTSYYDTVYYSIVPKNNSEIIGTNE